MYLNLSPHLQISIRKEIEWLSASESLFQVTTDTATLSVLGYLELQALTAPNSLSDCED